MNWLQLETRHGLPHPELLEAALEELGAVAVWFRDAGDEPLLEPAPGETPLWSNTIVAALFPADTNQELLAGSLAGLLAGNPLHFSRVATVTGMANGSKACKLRATASDSGWCRQTVPHPLKASSSTFRPAWHLVPGNIQRLVCVSNGWMR